MSLVLKRCISGLPKNECPRIPKRLLQRYRRSLTFNDTEQSIDRLKRSPVVFPNDLTSLSQTAADEPVAKCEIARNVGSQILYEKGQYADSMLSRFVGNFIMIFSNETYAQEVMYFCIGRNI